MKLRMLLMVAGLAGTLLLSTDQAGAAAIQLSPVRQELALSPGKSARLRFRLTNPTDSNVKMVVAINDFVARDDSGQPALVLKGGDSPRGLKQFLQPPDAVTVAARQVEEVEVAVAVPAAAKPGGYYGAVRFIPEQGGQGAQSVNLQASAASLVLLSVPGDVKEELRLGSFQLQRHDQPVKRLLVHSDGLQVKLGFENKGDTHTAPHGQVYLKKADEMIAQQTFNEQLPRSVVLPDSQRSWQLDFSESALSPGKYTAGVIVSYGANNQTVSREQSFWVLPLQYLIGVGVTLVALLILADMMLRRRRRRRRLPHYRRR